jgi:hypothetical protein
LTAGNVDFRQIISNDAGSYSECNSSIDRLSVVEAVIDRIERVNGGRFLRQNQVTGNVSYIRNISLINDDSTDIFLTLLLATCKVDTNESETNSR